METRPSPANNPLTRVFFPDCALRARSGLCVGWTDRGEQAICVLAVVHLPFDLRRVTEELKMAGGIARHPLTVLGPLTRHGDPDSGKLRQLCRAIPEGLCLDLSQPDPYSLPACTLLKHGRPTEGDSLLILYSQAGVLACLLPGVDCQAENSSGPETFSVFGRGSESVQENEEGGSGALEVETVLRVIQVGTRGLGTLRRDLEVSMDWKTQGVVAAVVQRSLASLGLILVSVLNLVSLPFRSSFCNRLSGSAVFQRLLRSTQTGCQIEARWNQLQSLLDTHSSQADDGRHELTDRPTMETKPKSRYESLRKGNLWAYLVIDMLLGVVLMGWVLHNRWPDVWANTIMSSANSTAGSLQRLLQWLMGAPAGLKLNSALAHFLGQFFLYHVYLWVGYLAFMKSVLSWMIWCMSLMGCLGLSVFLAVAADMVSLLTFHIYCFYVYAARIYSLQLTGLLALARLFGGKKWNVLRRRLDTCHYDVDQLFIGTLLFTILLFLLPTTALFYAVFTLLRLAVVLLQTFLTRTTDLLERLPAYSLLLCLTGGDAPASSVSFARVQQAGLGHSDTLVMEVQPMGVWDLLRLAYRAPQGKAKQSPVSANPVLTLGRKLITGQLIYPWQLVKSGETAVEKARESLGGSS